MAPPGRNDAFSPVLVGWVPTLRNMVQLESRES